MISALRADDPYERLIEQMIKLESRSQLELKAEKTEHERMKTVLSDTDSKISALHTSAAGFLDQISNPFGQKAVTMSDMAPFSISASSTAATGSHTLTVDRLARADTRISQQFTSADTSLRTFFDTNGPQIFTIGVASPTEADPQNRVNIEVVIDAQGTANAEILQEIQAAINTAMQQAIEDGVIDQDNRVNASVINETSTTSRLSVRSSQTGYNNRITFDDSASGLLSFLDINSSDVASGTAGGQVTYVGTDEADSELNSKFTLDGITLYRDSNRVSNALEGITLDLRQTSSETFDFSVAVDSEKVVTEIESFIKSFNDLIDYLNNRTHVDGDSGSRGDFAGDRSFMSLRMGLRTDLAREMDGLPAGAPQLLRDLGLSIERNGQLKIDDRSKLVEAIEQNVDGVKAFFSGEDGIAERVQQRLDFYRGSGGVINTRQESIDARIRRLSNRISVWDKRLEMRENQLRHEFANLQQAIARFQGQQQFMMSFMGGFM